MDVEEFVDDIIIPSLDGTKFIITMLISTIIFGTLFGICLYLVD